MITFVLPGLAIAVAGFLVFGLGVFMLTTGLVRFRRSKYVTPRPIQPAWLAIFLSYRIPKANVTERDIEEEGSAGSIVAGGFAIAIGFIMIRYSIS